MSSADVLAIHDSPNHDLERCMVFSKMEANEKEEVINKYRVCYRCLRGGHMYKKCKANVKCKIQGCTDRHHHLLHDMIIFRGEKAYRKLMVLHVNVW